MTNTWAREEALGAENLENVANALVMFKTLNYLPNMDVYSLSVGSKMGK